MPRQLVPQTIKKFRGLNVWTAYPSTSPEQATDILNVIPSGSGGVEKLRIPVVLTPDISQTTGPNSMIQFLNALTGARELFAQFGNIIGYYDTAFIWHSLDSSGSNGGFPFSYVAANNLLFGTNGLRDFKFDGTKITNWGIVPPASAPTIAILPAPPTSAANINAAASPISLGGGSSIFRQAGVATLVNIHSGVNVNDIIEITGVLDPSFDGIYEVSGLTGFGQPQMPNTFGPNTVSSSGSYTDYNTSGVFRFNNIVTVFTATPHGLQPNQTVTIAGVTDTTFNGTFVVTDTPDSTHFTFDQVGATAFSGSGTATPSAGQIYTLGGRRYRISYVNKETGHVSNASDASSATGNLNGSTVAAITGVPTSDPQVDQAWLWSTVDGGGDYYFNQLVNIFPGTTPAFLDTTLDSQLNTALLAPFVNNPPPLGFYVTNWNGRIIIFNLAGAPQQLAYSGYERILVGRPEESFPPNNRLRLQIGSDKLSGAGPLPNGLVIWSETNHMFMVRGTLQDVTVDAPVQLSTFLQPLPYLMGCASAFSVVETPQGLVWLASDLTIQIYDGISGPKSLSISFNPLLRRATPGQQTNARGVFFNFIEREWYALSIALDGSIDNNTIIIVDLDPNPVTNAGAFICAQDARLVADSMTVYQNADGSRTLMIGNVGFVKQFIALPDTVNGISNPITSTTGVLGGYWQSGLFGNEDPGAMKIFRWCRTITDQLDFQVIPYVIGEDDNFRFPQIGTPIPVPPDGRISINQKGRRIMYHVRFPSSDASANLLELTNNYIKLADR